MQESPEPLQLFQTLLNPEKPLSEADAAKAMIAVARETCWRRNQACDAVIARGAVACILGGAVRKFAVRPDGQRQIIDVIVTSDFLGFAPSDPAGRGGSVMESEHPEGILHRIEEKLNHLLGRRDDEWHDRPWAPLDSPFASYSPGDPSPRLFGGPRADAPGWDPSLAGPRFDRIDPGSVGTHAAHPTASYPGAQTPLLSSHSSAREYYLLMREKAEAEERDAHCYAQYRGRKMREFDREYADYRRDRQDCFDRDFDAWRRNRAGPAKAVQEPFRSEPKADAEEAGPVTAARQPGRR